MKVRFFDVCVLGRGIGGLVAASMLQKRGAKVLMVQDRHFTDFDPTLCEFLNGFTIKPVLKRLGFHPTEVNSIPALEAPLQIIIGDHRINCFGDEKRFERELRRELPEHSKQILQLFRDSSGHLELYQHLFNSRTPLPPQGYFARRRFKKVMEQVCDRQLLDFRPFTQELKTFGVGDDFTRVLRSLELALSGLISPWITGVRLAHLLTLIRWEGYFAPRGVLMLQEMLISKLKEHGGLVADCDGIQETMISGKFLRGMKLAGSEWDEVHCDATLLAGDGRGLSTMSPENRLMRQLRKQIDSLAVFALKAYQVYRLAPGGIPVGMHPQGILVPAEREEGGTERRQLIRAVRYVVHRVPGPGGKEKESLLGLSAFVRADCEPPTAERLSSEIRTAIRRIIPFVDEFLLEEPKKPYLSSLEGRPGDFRQGFVYSSDDRPLLGIAGVPSQTPLKNTFLAGDMVFPGLGLDGEVIAGMQASHLAGDVLAVDKNQL
ncbi:MAG: hypothetical protein V1495_02825 [Pseudomonadota bacterium]